MNSDFKDLLRCLNQFKVKYLVIGGYAVSYYAEPRYTKDIDIWVEPSRANSKKVYKVLQEFRAPIDSITEDDFARPGVVYIFGVPPCRVDILTRARGATFATAWKNRKKVDIDGIEVNFVSKKDLLKLKRSAGRPQDLIDIENLKL